MNEIASYIIKRQKSLAEQRTQWEASWQEVAEYVLPRKANFTTSQMPGKRQGEKVFDSTAPLALERFAASMESVLTPRNHKWHRLKTTFPNWGDNPILSKYLDEVNSCLFSARYQVGANFANQIHEVYLSLGAFGTGGLFIDDIPGRGLSYRALHLAEIFLAEDSSGRIDTVFRKFELTAKQAVSEFGLENLPMEIIKAAENHNSMDRAFNFIHAVLARENVNRNVNDFKGMPWASFYVTVDNPHLLREGGYYTLPYAISRYVTAPREIYGRSPAMMALADIKQVNEMEYTLIRAGQKAVDPPLLLTDDDVLSAFSLRPGALNYGGIGEDGRQKVLPLNTGVDLPLGFKMLEQKRKVINDAFLVSLFMVLVETPQMTATEALIRTQEKAALLAPAMGRQQSELLGPLILREIDILSRAGLLPPVPPQLAELDLSAVDIIYESAMSRAQRGEEALGMQRLFEAIVPLSANNPELLMAFDDQAILRLLADIYGVPSKIFRNEGGQIG